MSAAADDTWVPDACTLPTVERPLRVAEFDQVFADAVTGVERLAPDRLRLHLRPGVAGTVADLAARETACCAFFTFTLTIATDRLMLDIAVPADRSDVLDALARRSTTSPTGA